MTAAAATWVALVHHPVYDKNGRTVTTAITNLDIHDIARAARTFGLAGYFVVTPVEAQRDLAARIVGHWTSGSGREHNDKRTDALQNVRIAASLDAVITTLGDPYVVATGARERGGTVQFRALAVPSGRPTLLVFGTGWGLADEVFGKAHAVLDPIRGAGGYNHLSVRSAVAIVLDRLFGRLD
jgi:hypothetical protein